MRASTRINALEACSFALLAAGAALVATGWGGGCGQDEDADEEAALAAARATPAAPAAIRIADEADAELVFRYVDPTSGKVATANRVADIPAASRGTVVVIDPEAPAPAGWTHVADLSGALPATATPQQGFNLNVRIAAPAGPSGGKAARTVKQVVMFSTRGCPVCRTARQWFKAHGVVFTEHDVETDPAASGRLVAMGKASGVDPGQLRGVPVIFIDGKAVLGWDEGQIKRLLGV